MNELQNNVVFTRSMFKQIRSIKGGWNKEQLLLLGETWPPKKGWSQRLLGRTFSRDVLEQVRIAGGRKEQLLQLEPANDEKRFMQLEQRVKNLERIVVIGLKKYDI